MDKQIEAMASSCVKVSSCSECTTNGIPPSMVISRFSSQMDYAGPVDNDKFPVKSASSAATFEKL